MCVCVASLSFFLLQVFASFYLFSFAPSENKKKKKIKRKSFFSFFLTGERESLYKKGHLFYSLFFFSLFLFIPFMDMHPPPEREERDKTLFGHPVRSLNTHTHRLSTLLLLYIITPFFLFLFKFYILQEIFFRNTHKIILKGFTALHT